MIPFDEMVAHLDSVVFAHLANEATLDGRAVLGMYRATWVQPALGGMQTGLNEPSLVVRDADVADAGQGRRVTTAGQSVDVVSVEPDGTGTTLLVLRLRLP